MLRKALQAGKKFAEKIAPAVVADLLEEEFVLQGLFLIILTRKNFEVDFLVNPLDFFLQHF
jgi:hypothetical protein